MFLRYVLGLALAFGFGAGGLALAQDSSEPPPPKAAPRVSVMAEELPRAGAIVVFGASQPLGLDIVTALAAANKQVTAVIADGADHSALDALKVQVVTVNPLTLDRLKEMFASAPLRAVIMTFDASIDPMLGLDGASNIIDVTKAAGVPRLVFVSAIGAGDSAPAVPWYVRLLRGDAIAGAAATEQHLKMSGLDYTVVRAGWIVDGASTGAATLDKTDVPFSWIGHGDLARLVASVVDSRAMSGKIATAVDPSRASLLSLLF